jgi:hypothetical protein
MRLSLAVSSLFFLSSFFSPILPHVILDELSESGICLRR